jgi:hypothetical protein
MLRRYHIQITREALADSFSAEALETILAANLGQDLPSGQIGHPEFHFDDNRIAEGLAYMEAQRSLILAALAGSDPKPAWQAFGRLTHTAQDFYAHSNYVRLWRERHPELAEGQIDPLEPEIMNSPALVSGRVYLPWEPLSWLPVIGLLVRQLLPRDAHAWMNLDSPKSGPLFAFALQAGRQRTRREFEQIIRLLPSRRNLSDFCA